MGWSEPGANDPWNKGRGRNSPPDLDDLFKNIINKFGFGGGSKKGDPKKTSSSNGVWIVLLVVIVSLLVSSIYQLDEKERGVILRLGKYDRTEGPGLHFKLPLLDTLIPIETTTVRKVNIEERMLTRDSNIVEIELNIQYRVIDPVSFALRVENAERTLTHAAQSALRHEVGSVTMDPILTSGREDAAEKIKARLQGFLNRYQTGIQLTNVNIKDARPPSPVKAAFDDVQSARQDKDRFINQAQSYANSVVPEARGKAQRQLAEANAHKERVIARAKGEADRFNALFAEYRKSPKVTRERLYMDAMSEVYSNSSKVLIDVEGGNNMMYLPLDQIMKQAIKEESESVNTSIDIKSIADEVMNELRGRQDEQRKRGVR